ncbi:FMN-binding glutamate synthase family protein [Agaribacterium haliotis]|uniref:FMN-binding glutamate synthase family protein n=1 Tax=Agaribacterium haliotis TaxID=2013869 RepID=UPI000BB5563D|nr:FMN-binding glutamate synthase family protein [Agaribacterium haliotis]
MNEHLIFNLLGILALLFSSVILVLLVYIVILYLLDVSQSRHTIRRNYPVIGRFRYLFEHLGTFFRQYFFALDREELPFNRALRNWVYRAAKKNKLSNAFGSSNDLSKANMPIFLNAPYPVLEDDVETSQPALIGPLCQQPYQPQSYFNISGMSYGALSKVAVSALAQGAAKAGCWMNTGEGGLSPYHRAGCDLVFQIGTARYGVRDQHGNIDQEKIKTLAAMDNIKMFEIKLSQGAKPGKGGILPADKVSKEIADIRGIKEGQASISPNRQPGIDNDEALIDFIQQIKQLTGKPVGIKFVLGDVSWIDSFCQKVAALENNKRPDFFTVDGAEGGSGAAPQPLMDFVGLPLRYSLPAVKEALDKHGLSGRICLIASGKLINPAAVAMALAAGADFCVSARGFMFAIGCIQAMQCHNNRCPTGITTHNAKMQRGLDPELKSNRVANYHANLVDSVELIAHSCGRSNALDLNSANVSLINTSDNFSNSSVLAHVSN